MVKDAVHYVVFISINEMDGKEEMKKRTEEDTVCVPW
jgi:hypothetical protein